MSHRVDEVVSGPVKSKTLFPALLLHLIEQRPDHGYGLMHRIAGLCGDLLAVNTNTIYPLLRRLEERGFVSASWEHPTKRSRRIYAITEQGARASDAHQGSDAAVLEFRCGRDRATEDRALRFAPLVALTKL